MVSTSIAAIGLLLLCASAKSSKQTSRRLIQSTETPVWSLSSTMDNSGFTCDYYESMTCDDKQMGAINSGQTACIYFTNYEEQDVTFSDCSSSFDTKLYVIDGYDTAYGAVISDPYCDGDDCGACSGSNRERFTIPSLTPGDYTIILQGFSTNSGNYVVQTLCGDVFPDISTTESALTDIPISSEEPGFSCDYYESITCDDKQMGAINSGQTACIYFTNYAEQDVKFSDCSSSFDTKLFVLDGYDTVISTTYCDGDDCGACSGSNREEFTIPSLTPGDYTIILQGYSTRYGNYVVQTLCGDVFPDISTTESAMTDFPVSSEGPGFSCDYYDSVGCDDGYGSASGSINSHETACIYFENYEQQDVTFSDCQSGFDTELYVIDGYDTANGDIISSGYCDGDDCGACSASNREQFTIPSLDASLYTIIVQGYSSNNGNYEVEVFCGDTFPGYDTTEFPNMASTETTDDSVFPGWEGTKNCDNLKSFISCDDIRKSGGGTLCEQESDCWIIGSSYYQSIKLSTCGSDLDTTIKVLPLYEDRIISDNECTDGDDCECVNLTGLDDYYYVIQIEPSSEGQTGDYIFNFECSDKIDYNDPWTTYEPYDYGTTDDYNYNPQSTMDYDTDNEYNFWSTMESYDHQTTMEYEYEFGSTMEYELCCRCTDINIFNYDCYDYECRDQICAEDDYCCNNRWDYLCGIAAQAICPQNIVTCPTTTDDNESSDAPTTSDAQTQEPSIAPTQEPSAESDEASTSPTSEPTEDPTEDIGDNQPSLKPNTLLFVVSIAILIFSIL